MSLDTNVKAPDFTLKSNGGEDIQLSQQLAKGPVVLAFFPMAFTGVCTTEMCEFRDSLADFGQVDAQVFGISVDSRFSLDAFAKQNSINFPLLSDFNKQASTAFGVLYEDFLGMKGVSKRSVFVIDKSQTVRYRWVTDNAGEKPDLEAVKAAVKGL